MALSFLCALLKTNPFFFHFLLDCVRTTASSQLTVKGEISCDLAAVAQLVSVWKSSIFFSILSNIVAYSYVASCDICREAARCKHYTTNLIKSKHKEGHMKLQPNREEEGKASVIRKQIWNMNVSQKAQNIHSVFMSIYCSHLLAVFVKTLWLL